MEGFDSSKHSGVIAHFNQYTLKPGKMNPQLSNTIKKAMYCREKSDYDDFYIVSRKETEQQLMQAEDFLKTVREYLTDKI